MDGPQRNEIIGDWNNAKGAHYHLVYALWLLLREPAQSISFYQGNDLYARPIAPAQPNDDPAIVGLHVDKDDEDLWIQVKSTADPWTPTKLLSDSDNVLFNFICNARRSQVFGRMYRYKLVTQADVRRKPILDFVARPLDHKTTLAALENVLTKARKWLDSAGPPWADISNSDLRQLAFDILTGLAGGERLDLRMLKSEIETSLAFLYPDREAVQVIASTLIGELMSAAAAGPSAEPVYDAAWLNAAAGRPLRDRGLLDEDPIAACREASKAAWPRNWAPERFARRRLLEGELERFLSAPEPLFVLLGESGSGKSWALADWTTNRLVNSAVLFLPSADLDHRRTLDALVAGRLRDLTTADWPDNRAFLKRFEAAAIGGRGDLPAVIVLDNLGIPVDDPDIFRRDLGRLVQECAAHGIKLVLACKSHVWDLNRIAATEGGIPSNLIFRAEQAFHMTGILASSSGEGQQDSEFMSRGRDHPSRSLVLGALADDELTEAIALRLTDDTAGPASAQLRTPAYYPLRNPYLLDSYLSLVYAQLGDPDRLPPTVDIDSLLDERAGAILSEVAIGLGCALEDLQIAVDGLLDRLWDARQGRLGFKDSVTALNDGLPGLGHDALVRLRRVGFLAAGEPLHIAEDPLANRLFARRLGKRLCVSDSCLKGLDPTRDMGVVAALLRGEVTDRSGLAEDLLRRDRRWMQSVVEGLEPHAANDYQALALLTVLVRLDGRRHIGVFAAEALGRLAARENRVLDWLGGLYRSDRPEERFVGEYTLAHTVELAPERVEPLIRMRIERAIANGDYRQLDRKRKARILSGSLSPLRNINSPRGADVGRQLIEDFGEMKDSFGKEYLEFTHDVDETKGLVLLHGGREELDQLVAALESPEPELRYRTAATLRGVTFDRPERVRDALCDAIRLERHPHVLNQLLWTASPLVRAAPAALLEALANSNAIRWRSSISTAAVALSTLGDLVPHDPIRISRLLPKRLDRGNAEARALASEMLAYAWWRVAEYIPGAHEQLAVLTKPNVSRLEGWAKPFAWRGAAIAQLGLLSVDFGWGKDLVGWHTGYFRELLDGLFNQETSELVRRQAAFFVSQSGYPHLQKLLLQCLRDGEQHEVHPIKRDLFRAQGACTGACLEMLIHLAGALPDATVLLRDLPEDWQPIRAAWRLLEAGVYDDRFLEFVRGLSIDGSRSYSITAEREWNRCLRELARLDEAEERTQKGNTELALGDGRFLLNRSAQELAGRLEREPTRLLELLDLAVHGPDDLPILFYLQDVAPTASSLLLARVFARMFDPQPVTQNEAIDLCDQMLSALRPMGIGAVRDEYLAVYQTLRQGLTGQQRSSAPKALGKSAIGRSHMAAMTLLDRAGQQPGDPTWLVLGRLDARGWWESSRYSVDEGHMSTPMPAHLGYVFPAFRLALIAAGEPHGVVDPAHRLLAERSAASKVFTINADAFRTNPHPDADTVTRALATMQSLVQWLPLDERAWRWYGLLLFKEGKYDESEAAYWQSLCFRWCVGESRHNTLYELACLYAQTDRFAECRAQLVDADAIKELNRQWMLKDPDLEPVRNFVWFQELVNHRTEPFH